MLTAYRVADPPPKIVTPLMPNFALIVVFAQRYDKGAGGGTIVVDKSARPSAQIGRVGVWRSGGRPNISVAAPFVWRCLSGSTLAPFPHPAHRTGHADLLHPALGQDFT